MDSSSLTSSNTSLPQVEQLWKKISQDLTSGFRVNASGGHQVVRVYTRNEKLNWKFLIISSASSTMPPVFSVELIAYSNGKESWRLNLKYSPIPQPQWTHKWESLIDMYHGTELITADMQSAVISGYLESVVDKPSTESAFTRINYHPHTASWVESSAQ